MALKTYSNSTNGRACFLGICLTALLMLGACATISPPESATPGASLPAPELVGSPDSGGQAPDSRMLASHSLIREGYRLLTEEKWDAAIRVLERAVGINPHDGPGYYYLAEAWLGKQNLDLADRFNGLALLYLRGDDTWSERVLSQKKRINSTGNGR